MAIPNSADFASVGGGCAAFSGDRVVNSFPRHKVVKLDEGTSWLLSTISTSCLSSFTDARTACDVWTTAASLFAVDIGAKQSWIRHELHSLKKGTLSIKNYVARINNLCALLEASGTRIPEAEKA